MKKIIMIMIVLTIAAISSMCANAKDENYVEASGSQVESSESSEYSEPLPQEDVLAKFDGAVS